MKLKEKVNKALDRISTPTDKRILQTMGLFTGYEMYRAYKGDINIWSSLEMNLDPFHLGVNQEWYEHVKDGSERLMHLFDPNLMDERLIKGISVAVELSTQLAPYAIVGMLSYIGFNVLSRVRLKQHKPVKREGYMQVASVPIDRLIRNNIAGIDNLKDSPENFCKYLGMQELFVSSKKAQDRFGEAYIYEINKNLARVWTEDMLGGKIFPHFMFSGIFNKLLMKYNRKKDPISKANSLVYALMKADNQIFENKFDEILQYDLNKEKFSVWFGLDYLAPSKRDEAMSYLSGYETERDKFLYLAETADNMVTLGHDFSRHRDRALELLYGLAKRMSYEDKGELIRAGQTKHSVFVQSKDRTYVFKEGDRKDLEGEVEVMGKCGKIIDDLNENYQYFSIPRFYTILDETFVNKVQSVMVLERTSGETFAEKISKGSWTNFDIKSIVDYMTLLDSHLDVDSEEEDLSSKLFYRLNNLDFIPEHGTRAKVRDRVIDNIEPLLVSFDGFPLVMDLDHQPEQYIIGEKLVRVDFEKKSKVPSIMGYAKLFGFGEYLDIKSQEEWVSYALNDQISNLDEAEINIAYHNAMIYQSISVSSFISSSGTESILNNRNVRMSNALRSLGRLREMHPEYVKGYRSEYDSIDEAVTTILDSR